MRPNELRVYLVKTWHIPFAFFQSIFHQSYHFMILAAFELLIATLNKV